MLNFPKTVFTTLVLSAFLVPTGAWAMEIESNTDDENNVTITKMHSAKEKSDKDESEQEKPQKLPEPIPVEELKKIRYALKNDPSKKAEELFRKLSPYFQFEVIKDSENDENGQMERLTFLAGYLEQLHFDYKDYFEKGSFERNYFLSLLFAMGKHAHYREKLNGLLPEGWDLVTEDKLNENVRRKFSELAFTEDLKEVWDTDSSFFSGIRNFIRTEPAEPSSIEMAFNLYCNALSMKPPHFPVLSSIESVYMNNGKDEKKYNSKGTEDFLKKISSSLTCKMDAHPTMESYVRLYGAAYAYVSFCEKADHSDIIEYIMPNVDLEGFTNQAKEVIKLVKKIKKKDRRGKEPRKKEYEDSAFINIEWTLWHLIDE